MSMEEDDFENFVIHLVNKVRLGFPMDRPAGEFEIEEAVRLVLFEAGINNDPR